MDFSNLDFRKDKSDTEIRDDGLLYCTRCNEGLQRRFPIEGSDEDIVITGNCSCRAAAQEKQDAEERRMKKARRIESCRAEGIDNPVYLDYTFKADDSPNSTPSILAKQYVKSFRKMRRNGIGIIMYGTVGTGKTFYAACIANALIDNGVRVKMTTLSKIIGGAFGDNNWRAKLNRYQLLILDDLGAERQTDYALEIAHAVIDDRVTSGLPLIVTTNLSEEDMMNVDNLTLKRVYDRVLAACPIDIVLTGASRRMAARGDRRSEAIDILMGEED